MNLPDVHIPGAHYITWMFLCFVAIAVLRSLNDADWEGRLKDGECTFILELPDSPIWSPPAKPCYEDFESSFGELHEFPSRKHPELTIERVPRIDRVILQILALLLPVCLIGGLMHLAVSGRNANLVMDVALGAGLGLLLSAVICLGLWMLFGGWGPPLPLLFGTGGLIVSIMAGAISFVGRRGRSSRGSPG